jgi:predicted metal-dependent phosphoesterase TrpH
MTENLLNSYVDLHIHSYYSDGTMSPEEIVAYAKEHGVGLLAITDHDILKANFELRELCPRYGIDYITGIELDSLHRNTNFHILGYGFDLEDEEFQAFAQEDRNRLDEVSIRLLRKMQEELPGVSLADFQSFTYDRRKGGWKALHYFMERGLTKQLREGLAIYDQYGINNDNGAYPTVSEVIQQIHKAGGKAVLAHPGVSIKASDIQEFKAILIELLDLGLDGVECYYPGHSKEVTELCRAICEERGLLITTGSDCHGDFGKAKVGELMITKEQVRIG